MGCCGIMCALAERRANNSFLPQYSILMMYAECRGHSTYIRSWYIKGFVITTLAIRKERQTMEMFPFSWHQNLWKVGLRSNEMPPRRHAENEDYLLEIKHIARLFFV